MGVRSIKESEVTVSLDNSFKLFYFKKRNKKPRKLTRGEELWDTDGTHSLKEKLDSQELRRTRFEQHASVDLLSKMLPSDVSAPTILHFWLSLLNRKMLGRASD